MHIELVVPATTDGLVLQFLLPLHQSLDVEMVLESSDVIVDLQVLGALQAFGVQGHVVIDFGGHFLVDDGVAQCQLRYAEALGGLVDHAQVFQELPLDVLVLVEVESEGVLVRVEILRLLGDRAAREVQNAVVEPEAQGILVDGDLRRNEHLFSLLDLQDEQALGQVDLLEQKLDVKDLADGL